MSNASSYGTTLNTTPSPRMPPFSVVPYSAPLYSVTAPCGEDPSGDPAKAWSTDSVHPTPAARDSLKTTPQHCVVGPAEVVPYKLKALSIASPATGMPPSAPPLKL